MWMKILLWLLRQWIMARLSASPSARNRVVAREAATHAQDPSYRPVHFDEMFL